MSTAYNGLYSDPTTGVGNPYDPRTSWLPGFGAMTGPASDAGPAWDSSGNVAPPLAEQYWRDLGYTGPVGVQTGFGDNLQSEAAPELLAWLQQKGWKPVSTEGYNGYMDPSGALVQGSHFGNRTPDDATLIAGMAGLGVAGYAGGMFGGAAAGGGGGGAGAEAGASSLDAAYGGGAGGGGGGGGAGAAAPGATNFNPLQTGTGYETPALSGGGTSGTMGGTTGTGANPWGTDMSLGNTGGGGGGFTTGDWARLAQTGAGLYMQNQATKAAGQGQADANALMARMYDQNRADNMPLLNLRNETLPQIQGLMADPSIVSSLPGYQFQLKQGQDRLDNNLAAQGGYYSGRQLKASQQYGQDYAGSRIDQHLNRLMGVAGLGQIGAAANQTNNNLYSQQGSNGLAQQGNIRAGGYMGQGNIIGSGIGGWLNNWQDEQARKGYGGP